MGKMVTPSTPSPFISCILKSTQPPTKPREAPSMSIVIPEADLPRDLTLEQAVEAAYAGEMAEAASRLRRGLPVLLECDKDLAPFLYVNLRGRLKQAGLQ